MKKTIFNGAGVAIITPFTKNNVLNYDKLSELIEFQIKNHTDAIIICGTTGEASTLSDDEHTLAIKCAVETVKGRVPVIAGTGSNDTEYSLWLSKHAKNLGADALLQVTPYYNKTSQAGLVKHFFYIADRIDLPVILYNVPSRTGISIALETYKELEQHKNIIATKEASSNISLITQIAAECKNLDIYSGNDDQVVPILALGGKGVISVASNIIPREMHDICELFFKGNQNESRDLQLKLLKLINNLFLDVNPIPVKNAMNLMGFDVGELRLPLCDMSEKYKAVLVASMKEHGLLN